jgi:predicted DNA-binding transcriptional regulator YafY
MLPSWRCSIRRQTRTEPIARQNCRPGEPNRRARLPLGSRRSGRLRTVDASGSTSEQVTVVLTGAEAFVLSDALATWERTGTIAVDDQAAVRLLHDLSAVLEPVVEDAFSPDYADHLSQARRTVLEQ